MLITKKEETQILFYESFFPHFNQVVYPFSLFVVFFILFLPPKSEIMLLPYPTRRLIRCIHWKKVCFSFTAANRLYLKYTQTQMKITVHINTDEDNRKEGLHLFSLIFLLVDFLQIFPCSSTAHPSSPL